jgi:hypothetical protein
VRVVTTVLCCTTLCCNAQEEKQEGRKKDAEPLPIPVKLEVKVLRAVPPAATAAATDAADKNATAELTVLNSKELQRSREYSKLRICAGVAAPSATTAAASTAAAAAAAASASSVATNGSSRKRKASNSNAINTSSSCSTTNGASNRSDTGSSSTGLLSAHPNTLQQVCAAIVAQLRSPPLLFSGELWRVLIFDNRYGSELLELLQGVRQVCTANRYCHCPHQLLVRPMTHSTPL